MEDVLQRAMEATREAEFATLTARGQPIANPLFHYYRAGDRSLDIATGVAYPAKAERARANPKVGLLLGPAVHAYDPIAMLEHGAPDSQALKDQPVVLIAARAAVRDADIQANTDRYVRRFLEEHPKIGPRWEDVRSMVHYWARIWVHCTPVRILFWPTGRLDSQAPEIWRADEDVEFPASDPTPAEPPTPRAQWPADRDWRIRAERVLAQFPHPIVTAVDAEGYPLPFPVMSAALADDGLKLVLPKFCPWPRAGRASVSFGALGTFVGTLTQRGDTTLFKVAKALADLPNIFASSDAQLAALRQRLQGELDRRKQPVPSVRK